MRLEDRIRKNWSKSRKNINKTKAYEYALVNMKEFLSGLDEIFNSVVNSIKEETAKLQKEDFRKKKDS